MTTEIKKEILDLAAALKKDATVEGGKVVFPKDVFKSHLPEGLTIEQVKAVNNYSQTFTGAQALVTGEVGVKTLKDNKELKEVTSSVILPNGKSVAVLRREVTTRNMQTGAETVHHGYVTARSVIRVPGSQVTAVRSRVAELAAKAGLK